MTNKDRTAGQEPPIQWMLPRGYVQTPDASITLHCHVKDSYCDEYGCVPWTPHQPESAKETE